ncbi:MAG: hypothetical protein K2M98_02525 [Muribaculum sp.]|nr:hypothetical protein [Muribaculum sp.]
MNRLPSTALRLSAWLIILLATVPPCFARKADLNLPSVSEVIPGYENTDSVKHRLLASGMHTIEGIWQFPDDGALIAVERTVGKQANAATRYHMVILWSPRRSVAPGTIMGIIAPTAKKGVYTTCIYTSTLGARQLTAPSSYTLKMTDENRFSITPDHSIKFKANLWRLIPYLSNTLALRVQTQDNTPTDIEGCVRLFPTPAAGVNGPRYL